MNQDWKKLRDQAAAKLSDEEYAAIASNNYQLGMVSSAEMQVAHLLKLSGDAYMAKQDDLAKYLRVLADEKREEAKEMRAAFNREYMK